MADTKDVSDRHAPEWERAEQGWRKELELALTLARNATNGWACYAKRQNEYDEIARLHSAIADVERRLSALPPVGQEAGGDCRDRDGMSLVERIESYDFEMPGGGWRLNNYGGWTQLKAQLAALPPVQEPPKRWKECCRGCSGRFDLADKECECGGMLMTVCEDVPASSPSQGVRLGDLKALLDGAAVTCDSSPGDRRVSIRFGNDLKRAQAFYRWLSAALEGANNGKA